MASPTTRDWGSSDMPSLADLIRMGKQYIGDAMPGGSLNPETAPVARQANYLSGILDPASQVSQDATNWHKRTQIGLKDQLAGRQTPEAEQAYQTMMMAAGMAPIGMTAWHGSPHKFDKFSLDKIGTGEGAQAYGHGLYLAESPEVAQSYKNGLSNRNQTLWRDIEDVLPDALKGKAPDFSDAVLSGKKFDDLVASVKPPFQKALLRQNKDKLEGIINSQQSGGALYKTDIPDEAVARFLDWDKPLSQQIEHLGKLSDAELYNLGITREGLDAFTGKQLTGGDLMRFSDNQHGGGFLNKKGIPGIRYLDGGSRNTAQRWVAKHPMGGENTFNTQSELDAFVRRNPEFKAIAPDQTSNFVAFDPEMIRILERNGQATGLEPWKPGEYRLKDLIGKE
jgi:hypothetical protein